MTVVNIPNRLDHRLDIGQTRHICRKSVLEAGHSVLAVDRPLFQIQSEALQESHELVMR